MELVKLEKIDLRKQWEKEDLDFTPWLAQEENIELLSDVIGIELEVQGQEENVGPFRADILCTDTANSNYVLIENQLEKTDHTHLGQLMTYAAGLDAVTIIWIAQKFTEEHRAALDWLNNITNDTFNFFGIEIELYKINPSTATPMFKIVSKPNDWTKSVRKTASSQNLTETKLLQQDYWASLKNYMEDSKSKIKINKPLPQNWTNIAIGKSDFWITASMSTKNNTLTVWLSISGEKAKQNFDALSEQAKEQSLIEISADIEWLRMDDRKQSAIILTTTGNIKDKSDWEKQFEWFRENLALFTEFFKPKIKRLK